MSFIEDLTKKWENLPNTTSPEHPMSFMEIFKEPVKAYCQTRQEAAQTAYSAGNLTLARAYAGDSDDVY